MTREKRAFFYLATHLWQHHLADDEVAGTREKPIRRAFTRDLKLALEMCGMYRTDVRFDSRVGMGVAGTGVKQGVNELRESILGTKEKGLLLCGRDVCKFSRGETYERLHLNAK